ncbi:MAG: SDR family NAD(P)-dependent oxidoreductase [Nannocystaceae bacterium]
MAPPGQRRAAAELRLGPSLVGLGECLRGADEAVAALRLPEGEARAPWPVHPAHLEAAAALLGALADPQDRAPLSILAGAEAVRVAGPPRAARWCRVALRPSSTPERPRGDVWIHAEDGAEVAALLGVRLAPPPWTIARPASAARLAEWTLAMEWRPAPRGPASAPPPTGWIVLADTRGVGAGLVRSIPREGAGEVPVATALAGAEGLDPADPAAIRAWIAEVLPGMGPRPAVVFAWPLDITREFEQSAARIERAQVLACAGLLHLVQALVAATSPAAADPLVATVAGPVDAAAASSPPGGVSPSLWVLTRGAQAVAPGESPGVAAAPVWGLARTVALEHPELWGGLLDLDPDEATPMNPAAILAEIVGADGEDHVALRGRADHPEAERRALDSTARTPSLDPGAGRLDVGSGPVGERRVARLVQAPPSIPAEPLALTADGTYLITGGLGAVGLELAAWLIDRGARHLVLTGRGGVPPRDAWGRLPDDDPAAPRVAALRQLEALGAAVTVIAADVADPAAVDRLFEALDRDHPPLRGVIHAAGLAARTDLVHTDAATLAAVLRPKLTGAWLLDRRTRGRPLDLFVLFSSAASAWGSAFGGAYSAANHALDALAAARRAAGEPALAVSWGGWDSGGMVTAEAEHYFTAIGLGLMPPAHALEALEVLLAGDAAHRVVSPVDWAIFKPVLEARRARPLLAAIEVKARASGGGDLRAALAGAPATERFERLVAHVRGAAAAVLRCASADEIEVDQGFFQLGMDSLMSAQLRARLQEDLAAALPATAVFEHPTVEKLARFVDGALFGDAGGASTAPGAPGAASGATEEAPPLGVPRAPGAGGALAALGAPGAASAATEEAPPLGVPRAPEAASLLGVTGAPEAVALVAPEIPRDLETILASGLDDLETIRAAASPGTEVESTATAPGGPNRTPTAGEPLTDPSEDELLAELARELDALTALRDDDGELR